LAGAEPKTPGARLRDLRDVSRLAAALAGEAYSQTRLAFPAAKGTTNLRTQILEILGAK